MVVEFFGCCLETTVLAHPDNLSLSLQNPQLSVVEAHDLTLKDDGTSH